MRICLFKKFLAVVAGAACLAGPVATLWAQDAVTTNAPTPVIIPTVALHLSTPALQVLQLAQAKVSDTTIMAFVQGSQANYGLTAPAIIYLRQQGVSDAVLTAMLTPPTLVLATNLAVPQPTPAPVPQVADAAASQPPNTTVIDASSVTYVEVPPPDPTVVYYQTYYQNYYQTYGYYPPVYYTIGAYGNYHGNGNGGYHGGNNGGFHGGGNYGGGNNGGHGGSIGNGGGYAVPRH